ncbi:MAG: hypothetical protein L0Z55_05690 [Planctomycetes bacterium]|nr:hypothetical protein [Planctomycetota bacterium]
MNSLAGHSRVLYMAILLVAVGFASGCYDEDDEFFVGTAVTPAKSASIGDAPVVAEHMSQAAIEAGDVSLDALIAHGRALFIAMFNTLDGAGRPETTGTGLPRPRRESPENFNRISADDANSCAGCHNLPQVGAGGDNVANVFVLGQRFPFLNFDGGPGDNGDPSLTLKSAANERNTLGMFGSGYVELLAREMSLELQAIRASAIAQAAAAGQSVSLDLVTKGVSFGTIFAGPDGSVDTSEVEGVDADLVIKPFHQKGVVVSVREFSNNAFNHHHGMQSAERFGAGTDADNDGVRDELTVGDITAATAFQATLPVPGVVLPLDPEALAAVVNGSELFDAIGCASCHLRTLKLEDPVFTDPNSLNPPGNLRPEDVSNPLEIDLTLETPQPRLTREVDGSVLVPLFSDLKRHDMGEELDNEVVVQAGVPTGKWITRKLWGFANEPPYLHHGRALLISEAILAHGGEAELARQEFEELSSSNQADLIEFLKTLQLLQPGTTSRIVFANGSGVIGDEPQIPVHLDHFEIAQGTVPIEEAIEHGKRLFKANSNQLDGALRPETTGTGLPRERREGVEAFNRISAPDANSCAGCHNVPRTGGGGDNVANVFVLGQRFPFVNFDGGEGDNFEEHTLKEVANERNTLGMFGSGYIELLAREMTMDLHAIRSQAEVEAIATEAPVTKSLDTKGVNFGEITAIPIVPSTSIGFVQFDTSAVEGVNADLIIRPFHQKGVVVSLREFTNNALNHHHGLQSVERFGFESDDDADGVFDEISEGDVTAVALYQATLAVPGKVLPATAEGRAAAQRGEQLFGQIGCASCHIKELRLNDPIFTEPNPFNPSGNLHPDNFKGDGIVAVDLTEKALEPRLPREEDGSVLVPAFTDLKRHDMGPVLDTEVLVQGGVPTKEWLTRKLWGIANEPPFLHHGRALLISEAIESHGGEAQPARNAYLSLNEADRANIVEFLKTLQILPEGTTDLVVQAPE